ncbi:MAG: hypothetical protein D6806_02165 [Deltaproteobacteria bacterium]|nr:MAG: hypothetical protein D6806_02165 [Deltaproteobacteria bacterium]
MKKILSVARVTFRESIRNKTILAILLLGLAFAASALLLAELALDQRVRVITDWGLFCLSAFGVGLAIILGVNLVHKEVVRKTLYVVLARPMERWKYVVGKFLGVLAVLSVEVVVLSLALVAMLALEGKGLKLLLFKAMVLSAAEIVLVAAIALFFSSFSSPYLSGFFALGVFLVGRSLPVLEKLIEKIEIPAVHWPLKGMFFVLPDLADLNLASRVVNDIPIEWASVANGVLYAVGYAGLLVLFSCLVFGRRELS